MSRTESNIQLIRYGKSKNDESAHSKWRKRNGDHVYL